MDKKKQIINAAIELIIEGGFSNFSVGKVANKLNMSKGVFTYHFPTKDSLLSSMVVSFYEEAADYMQQHIRTDKSAIDTLDSYIESCLYFAAEKKEQTIAVTDIILNSRTQDGERLFKDDNSIYKPLSEIFKYGQETEKIFRVFSRDIMATSIRSVIDSIALAIAKGEIADVDQAVNEVKMIFNSAVLK